MNHLARQNLEYFLAWQQKWRRGYVERDPWAGAARVLFDRHLALKRSKARAWLETESSRWRKCVPASEIVAVSWGDGAAPRSIQTARNFRRESWASGSIEKKT